jgi:putative ABC transport system permease protein
MKKLSSFISNVWLGLSTHKLRSFLTMLGVVIGVAAVITLMSIGQGTSAAILSRLQGLGSNLLFISPGQTVTTGGVRTGFGSASTLTLEDAVAIYQDIPNVAEVAPSSSASLQVIAGAQNTRTRISGVTLEYQDVYTLQMAEGDFISQDQYDSAMKVAVLGPDVSSTLFPDSDPVGQTVRIGNSVTTVIGVLQSKGQSFGSTDDAILIPLTTLQQIAAQTLTATGGHVVNSLVVSVTSEQYIDQVTADITSLLQERHNIDPTVGNDFTITSMQDLINTITQATSSITLLLGAIAAISLLVGGIGVMNIMLVSVLERTREIGIRKALGARERDIWIQFLIEAASLTFTGGIIGVVAGWVVSYIISSLGLVTTLVSANIVVLAVSVSIGIGLFFGFYPAWNASRLDPIQALRSE